MPTTTTTEAPTTTTAAPTTTTEAPTTTTTEATTTTAEETTTTTVAAEVPADAEDDDEPMWWFWILLALVVGGGAWWFIASKNKKAAALQTWQEGAARAIDDGRLIVLELGPAGAAAGNAEPALQRRLNTLDQSLAALEPGAPSAAAQQALGLARMHASDLEAAIASDVRLRIGPPAPNEDQLATSAALLGQRSNELENALNGLRQAAAPPAS